MKQERHFALFMDGQLKYTAPKGAGGSELHLTSGTRARKVGTTEWNLRIPGEKKVYVLINKDPSKCPPKEKNFSCDMDDWV